MPSGEFVPGCQLDVSEVQNRSEQTSHDHHLPLDSRTCRSGGNLLEDGNILESALIGNW